MEFFNTLGVSPFDTKEYIKNEYRKMIKKYHPDKNNSNGEYFVKINNAYEKILDIFECCDIKIHKLKDTNKLKGENIYTNLYITIEELFKGNLCSVMYEKRICDSFKYSDKCKSCYGTGININEVKTFYDNKTYYNAEKCRFCLKNTKEYEVKTKTLSLCIPSFFYENKYTFEGEGHDIIGGLSGDLIVNINLKKDDNFWIIGHNLYTQINITLKEALTGFKYIMTHPNGDTLYIEDDNEIITSNTKKCYKGLGLKQDDKFGYFQVNFNIIFPDTLNTETKEKLRKIL